MDDLKKFGVQEMNALEMKEVDGGNPFVWLVIGLLVSEAIDPDSDDDFWKGYNDYRKK